MAQIAASVGSTDPEVSKLQASLTANPSFQFTTDFHVTLAFLKRDLNQAKKCAIYASNIFQAGLPIKVSVRALVYVPNKILTALVNIEHDKIKTDNDFAHITLMIGEWKPVQSNDILKALFNVKYGLKKDMT